MSDDNIKWQPVMLVVNNRVECECGALAVFVSCKVKDIADGEYNVLNDVDVWCQDCFFKAQKEME